MSGHAIRRRVPAGPGTGRVWPWVYVGWLALLTVAVGLSARWLLDRVVEMPAVRDGPLDERVAAVGGAFKDVAFAIIVLAMYVVGVAINLPRMRTHVDLVATLKPGGFLVRLTGRLKRRAHNVQEIRVVESFAGGGDVEIWCRIRNGWMRWFHLDRRTSRHWLGDWCRGLESVRQAMLDATFVGKVEIDWVETESDVDPLRPGEPVRLSRTLWVDIIVTLVFVALAVFTTVDMLANPFEPKGEYVFNWPAMLCISLFLLLTWRPTWPTMSIEGKRLIVRDRVWPAVYNDVLRSDITCVRRAARGPTSTETVIEIAGDRPRWVSVHVPGERLPQWLGVPLMIDAEEGEPGRKVPLFSAGH